MNAHSGALLILLAACAALGASLREEVPPGDQLELHASVSTTHYDEETVLHWRRQGQLFVSLEGRGSLSFPEVRALRRTLLSAPPGRDRLPALLGLTPEAFRAHHIDLTYEQFLARAEQVATGAAPSGGLYGRASASFELRLDDLRVSSQGWPRAYMLPWRIGPTESYSPTVPAAFAALLAPKDAGVPFLDGRRYWEEEFWTDGRAWRQP